MPEPEEDGVKTTIVLADDHAVVRSALRMLLEAEPGFEVVAEAGVRFLRQSSPPAEPSASP